MKAKGFRVFVGMAFALACSHCVCSPSSSVPAAAVSKTATNEVWAPKDANIYPTLQEKSQLRQGVALTCSDRPPLHHHLYSQTVAGAVFQALSDPLVHVSKPLHASARLEVLVTPLLQGRPFTSLEGFIQHAAQPTHMELATASIRAIYRTARVFGLSCGGYRVEADNLQSPFALRVVGGELLGPALVSSKGLDICESVRGHDFIGKSYYAVNNQLGGSYSNVFRGGGHKRIETQHAFSFNDANGQVDVHRDLIAKGEYVSIQEFSRRASPEEIVDLFKNLQQTIRDAGLQGQPFRIASNAGYNAGQQVAHFAFHVGACQGGKKCLGDTQLAPSARPCNAHRILATQDPRDIIPFVHHKTLLIYDIDDTLITTSKLNTKSVAITTPQTQPTTQETHQAVIEAAKRTSYVIGLSLRNHRGQVDQLVNQVSQQFGPVFKGFESVQPYQCVAGDPTRGFFEGCLFTDWTDKGETLVNFLGRAAVRRVLQSQPHQVERVVFIDNHFDNCWSVKQALQQADALGIKESISFYYKLQKPQQQGSRWVTL